MPTACSDLVTKHLLAFRWANPNALTYLHEKRTTEGASAYVTYELCAYCYGARIPHPRHLLAFVPQGTDALGSLQ